MVTYDEGKVYLRDIRNGTIYPYERFLAADRNFAPVIPNPVKATEVESTPAAPHTPPALPPHEQTRHPEPLGTGPLPFRPAPGAA